MFRWRKQKKHITPPTDRRFTCNAVGCETEVIGQPFLCGKHRCPGGDGSGKCRWPRFNGPLCNECKISGDCQYICYHDECWKFHIGGSRYCRDHTCHWSGCHEEVYLGLKCCWYHQCAGPRYGFNCENPTTVARGIDGRVKYYCDIHDPIPAPPPSRQEYFQPHRQNDPQDTLIRHYTTPQQQHSMKEFAEGVYHDTDKSWTTWTG